MSPTSRKSTGTHDGDARGDLRDNGKMNGERLGNDFADAHPRIRRGERILENHLHLAALGAQFFSAEREKFTAVRLDQP